MAWHVSGRIAGNGAGTKVFAGGFLMCGKQRPGGSAVYNCVLLHLLIEKADVLYTAANVRIIFFNWATGGTVKKIYNFF
jgi:hypothetical protein